MSVKILKNRIILTDGSAVTVTVSDGILIDDILIGGMKAEGYRVITGRDIFPVVGRDIKDYLIKEGLIKD